MSKANSRFSLFGELSEHFIRVWQRSPGANFGNAVGIAYGNIAKAWSQGIFELEETRSYSPFWNRFCDLYAPDYDLAKKLKGGLPTHYQSWESWCPYTIQDLEFWRQMTPYVARTLFPLINSFADPTKSMPGASDHPVLHFRAGDVPFCRHREYQLPKYSFCQFFIV